MSPPGRIEEEEVANNQIVTMIYVTTRRGHQVKPMFTNKDFFDSRHSFFFRDLST